MQDEAPEREDFELKRVGYSLKETEFQGTLIYPLDEELKTDETPGILLVPNWMGPGEAADDKAMRIAEEFEAVVFIADMYGVDVRPANSDEAAQAAGTVRSDRAMMRARGKRALEIFREQAGEAPFDKDKIVAIGFCFGGGTVLEMARAGASVDAVVSFHGDLVSPMSGMEAAQSYILVLHGAEDPYVPQSDVQAFVDELLAANLGDSWSLIQFGGAVHSFTDPSASAAGQAEFNPLVSAKAFEAMDELMETLYGEDD